MADFVCDAACGLRRSYREGGPELHAAGAGKRSHDPAAEGLHKREKHASAFSGGALKSKARLQWQAGVGGGV
jgi:hypothetical protein